MDCNEVLFVITAFLFSCVLQNAGASDPQVSAFYFTPPHHVTVVESQVLRLKCTPKNMNNEIVWSRMSADGQQQQVLRSVARASFDMFGYILVLTNVTWEDTANYRCAVTKGQNELDFFVVDVNVHSVPHWRQAPQDLLLYPGYNGKIVCDAVGTPSPAISWEINGNPITVSEAGLAQFNGTDRAGLTNTFYLDGDSLTIINAQYDNAAAVRCIASNVYGKLIADMYIDVLEMAPRFVNTPLSVSQVVTGKDITMRCLAIGSPKPSIKWTLNSELITFNSTSSEPHFQLDKDGSLTIYRAMKPHDEGIYTCEANNLLGKKLASGELQVKARTRVRSHTVETIAKKGKHIVLRCSVEADTALHVTVTWDKNSKPLNVGCSEEDRIFQPPGIGGNDSLLVMRSLTREDSGIYGCVAQTALDKAADQSILIVQDVPSRPGPVEVTYRSDFSVVISWQPGDEHNSPTELFIIYMNSTRDRGFWKILKMLPPGSRSTKVDLEPWTFYNFRVKQLNGVGYSELSESSPVYRTAPSRPYSNPENVKAESTNNSYINVSWKIVPRRQHNGPGFHYIIYWRRPAFDDTWYHQRVENYTVNSGVISTSGEYAEYEIRVRAANEVGMAPTPWSIQVHPMPERNYTGGSSDGNSDQEFHVSVPSEVPNKFRAKAISSSEIVVMWKPISTNRTSNTMQGYKVYYWRRGSVNLKHVTTSPTTMMVTLTDLMPASEYVIHMFGFNRAGEGPTTDNVIVQTPEDIPGPVNNFTIELVGTSLHVEWDAPSSPNGVLLGYQIIITKYEPMTSSFPGESVFIGNPDITNYVFLDLIPDATYRVEVQASTAAGFGTVSYWEGILNLLK